MKSSTCYAVTFSVTLINVLAFQWQYIATPALAGPVGIAVLATCAAAPPYCITAGLVGLFSIIAGSFSATNRAGQSSNSLPSIAMKRGDGRKIFHDLGNGIIQNFLDTSVLEYGKLHHLWDDMGFHYTATRHSKTNDPVLTVHLGGSSKVNRQHADGRRQSYHEIDSFSASWNEAGTVFDEFSDGDAQQEGNIARANLFEDPDECTMLKAGYICSTLTPVPDDETVNISIGPQGPGFATEIVPACGA